MVDEVVDLGFEGLDVGGGIGLLGGEDAVDERFDLFLLLINQLHAYQSSQRSRFADSRLSRPMSLHSPRITLDLSIVV